MRSWRLGMIRGKLLHGVLLWVAHVGVPGVIQRFRASKKNPAAHLLGLIGWKGFEGRREVMMLVSEPVWHGKIYRLGCSSHRADLMLCCSCSDPRGTPTGDATAPRATQVPNWNQILKRTMTSCCSDCLWGNDSQTRRWGARSCH